LWKKCNRGRKCNKICYTQTGSVLQGCNKNVTAHVTHFVTDVTGNDKKGDSENVKVSKSI